MGASFSWTFDQTFEPRTAWWVDGVPVPRVTAETATPRTLTLRWRVGTQRLLDVLRPLKSDEGKVDVLGTDDGGFIAVDRADGANTYTLTPPTAREPLRQETTYHVARYEEDLISQSVEEWDVEVEFIRGKDRGDMPTLSQPVSGAAFSWTFDQAFARRSAAAWEFGTRRGALTSDRVDADVIGTGEDGVRRFELTARLTTEQAHVFEAAYARLGAGRVREVPDAPNVAVDDSADGAATLGIDSPDPATVANGEYVLREWDSTRLNDGYQEVSMTIAAKD